MAIKFGDGRYRSELLDEERVKEISDYIQQLNEDEYLVFAQMLTEFVNGEGKVDMKDGGQNLTLYEVFSRLEYQTQPVDIETWLFEDYYMGRTGESLWPKLREDFIELFSGSYHEVILTGSIGLNALVQEADGGLPTLRERIGKTEDVAVLLEDGLAISSTEPGHHSGVKEVLRVELANGMRLDLTPDHEVQVYREGVVWVRADELGIGDRVLRARRIQTIPSSVISESKAELAACMIVRGSSLEGERAELVIPSDVCKSDNHTVAVFLKKLWQLKEKTAWLLPERVIRQVQLLLLRFDIQSKISKVVEADKEGWDLVIDDVGSFEVFCDRIGSLSEKGNDLSKDVAYEPVISIEQLDEPIEVGDIGAHNGNRFLANGISVHNSIGYGKSFFSNLCMCRILYELSCLNNPQQSYGLAPDSQIVLTNYHINLKLSKKVVFQGISHMIQNSPYFMEHFKPRFTLSELRFPRNIHLIPISRTSTGSLGLNIFSAIIDECLGENSYLSVKKCLQSKKKASTFCDVKITDLEVGRKYQLRCYDHKTNKLQEGWGVVGLSAVQPTVYIKTEEGELGCSYEHPVLVRRGNWLVYEYAVSLRVGDEIVTCRSEYGRQGKDERRAEGVQQRQKSIRRAEGQAKRVSQAENGREECILWQDAYGRGQSQDAGCEAAVKGKDQTFGGDQGQDAGGMGEAAARKADDGCYAQEDVEVGQKANRERWDSSTFSIDNGRSGQSQLWQKAFGRREKNNRGCQSRSNSFSGNTSEDVNSSQGEVSFGGKQTEDFGGQYQSDTGQEAVLFGMDARSEWDNGSLSVEGREIYFGRAVQTSEGSLGDRRGPVRPSRIRIRGATTIDDSRFYGGIEYGRGNNDRSEAWSQYLSLQGKIATKSVMDALLGEELQVDVDNGKRIDFQGIEGAICNKTVCGYAGQYGENENFSEGFGGQYQSDTGQETVLFGLDDRSQWDKGSLSVGTRKIGFGRVMQTSKCSLGDRGRQNGAGRVQLRGTIAINDSRFYGGTEYGRGNNGRSKTRCKHTASQRDKAVNGSMGVLFREQLQANVGIEKSASSRCIERAICNRTVYGCIGQYEEIKDTPFGVRMERLRVEELPANLKLTKIISIEYRGPEQTYKVETEFKTIIANGFITHNTSFQQAAKASIARKNLTGGEDAANYIIDAKTLYNSILRRMKSRFQRSGRLPGKLILPASKRTRNDFTLQRILASMNDSGIFVRDYCFTGDTRVSLMDGRELSFFELEKEFGKNKSFEVYSWNGKDFVPGKAKGVVLTKKNAPVVRVTLDNGESERCTYDHPWMLKDGSYCRAIDLKLGDSLMPLYRRKSTKEKDRLGGYDMWRDPNTGKWVFTHRLNARDKFGSQYTKEFNVHHKDFDKLNNTTSNLELIERNEHLKVHSECMIALLKYVKSDEHRKYASEHMSQLHADKEWAKKRDERSRISLRQNRNNPVYAKRFTDASSRNLKSWLQSDEGKAENRRKLLEIAKRRRYHHVTVDEIIRLIDTGMNSMMIAKEFGCSQALVSKRLKHLGGFARVAKGRNHSVVSVVPDGFADVYDIKEVEEYHNFALSSGVVVHNSQWNVMPEDRFCGKTFKVFVGGDTRRSRLLGDDESIEISQEEIDEGVRIIDVPIEYQPDFSKDIDDALRDIAGVETVTIRPFLRRYEKILEAVNTKYEHPFEDIEWDTGKPMRFKLNQMVRKDSQGDRVPIINPMCPRYIHLDPSLTGDAFGFCMAHVSGYVQVRRRDLQTSQLMVEEAPVIVVDFMLRIVPAMGDEIDHGRVRSMIYALTEYGYPIHFVTMDSFQSIATKQKLKSKGYRSEIVSVDRPLDPYDNLKEVFYENRIVMYHYQPVIDELRYLILDGVRNKVDHLPERSKDVADALCGVTFTLSTRTTGVPLGIIEGAVEGEEREDYSWIHENSNLVPKDEQEPEPLTLEPLPPFV